MESSEGCACADIPSKVTKFFTKWHAWEYDITVIKKWLNIQIEVNYEPKKWGLAALVLFDNTYSKGWKIMPAIYIGPLCTGFEIRYRMGMK
jgi:hypothetical protein